MDQIQIYLDIVPLPLLFAVAIAVAVCFFLVPAHLRLGVALAIMPIWLTVGRLPELGVISAAAKVSGVGTYMLVAVAALMHPGQRRSLHPLLFVLVVVGVYSFAYVLRAGDAERMMIIRFQWLVLVLAALAVVRTMVDQASTAYVIRWLGYGCALALLLPFSAIVRDPMGSFGRGIGRFFPYGANTNQIGVLFSLSVPLLLYLTIRSKNIAARVVYISFMAIASGMCVLSASRMGLLAMLIASVPLLMAVVRRPILTVTIIAVGFGGLTWLFGRTPDVNLERLGSLETGRFAIWRSYMDIIAERPVFGLLGRSGEDAQASAAIGMHPHSAYVEMLYVGGLSFLLPVLLVIVMAVLAGVQVWRRRRLYSIDPLLVSLFASSLAALTLHGFANGIVMYPTYSWAFWFVIVVGWFLTTKRAMIDGTHPVAEGLHTSQWEEAGQYGDDWDYADDQITGQPATW